MNLGQHIAESILEQSEIKTALYPGAFKPPHKGHFNVVKSILDKVDEVIIIISNHNREGITPQQSLKIWELFIKQLPNKKISIQISKDPSPIKNTYDVIKSFPAKSYIALYGKEENDKFKDLINKEKYPNVTVINIGNFENLNSSDFRTALANNGDITKFLPDNITPEMYKGVLNNIKENLESHSLEELTRAGLLDEDSDYAGMIGKAVLELMKTFSKQGHSGMSAQWTRELFNKLANYETLTPITSDINEWNDISEMSGYPFWQNKRNPAIFSEDCGKTWWHVDEKNKKSLKEGFLIAIKQFQQILNETENLGTKLDVDISSNNFMVPYQDLLNKIEGDQGKGDLYYEIEQAIFDKKPKKIYQILKKGAPEYIELLNLNEGDKISGGLAQGKTLEDIAKKHSYDDSKDSLDKTKYEYVLNQLKQQLKKGIEVELEHTTSKETAEEISMDHLWEDPKYYDKLEKIEKKPINEMTEKELKYWALFYHIFQKLNTPDFEKAYNELLPKLKGEELEALEYYYKLFNDHDKLQKLLEALEEGKNIGTIYHYTDIAYLDNILKSNELYSSQNNYANHTKGDNYSISFTRNKNFHKHPNRNISGMGLRITIDGEKLSNKYSINPIAEPGFRKKFNNNEEEERIQGPKEFKVTNLDSYVKSYDVLIDQILKDFDKYKALGVKSRIPFVLSAINKLKNNSKVKYYLKDKEITYDDVLSLIVPSSLNENYQQNPKQLKEIIKSLIEYMIDKGMNIKPLPKLKLINNDIQNSENSLGKTGYYNPGNREIVIYTLGRHNIDCAKTFCHEIIHHEQNLEGRLKNIGKTTNVNEDDNLKKIEEETYLKSQILYREWADKQRL